MFIKNIFRTFKLAKNYSFRFTHAKSTINIDHVPMIDEYLKKERSANENLLKSAESDNKNFKDRLFYIETYGCQMNVSDSEIINGILQSSGFTLTKNVSEADIIFLNTCAIRENAENKIWSRLKELKALKRKSGKKLITGVLGCMAERLKIEIVEKSKSVDIVAGPDAYRDLPNLINNLNLSLEETYADITPVRLSENKSQAFVSIMRGCNNMCAFCIVPFTRGRERSRPVESILEEVKNLRDEGVKEITLLGQNVNSYHDFDENSSTTRKEHINSEGFGETFKLRGGAGHRFSELLDLLASEAPEVRFRFTSPHPKDFPDPVLDVITKHPNICKNIHLPAQSGNNEVLKRMRRNYSVEAYLSLASRIREKIPGITFSSDFICGFCGETEEEFKDTLTLLETMKYENAFLFAYSMREKTHAHRKLQDDVPEEVKQRRLREMIEVFHKNQELIAQEEIGRFHIVLIEGKAKYPGQLKGRTDTNKRVVIQDDPIISLSNKNLQGKSNESLISLLKSLTKKETAHKNTNEEVDPSSFDKVNSQTGDFIIAYVESVSKKSLYCKPLAKTTISDFSRLTQNRPWFS